MPPAFCLFELVLPEFVAPAVVLSLLASLWCLSFFFVDVVTAG